MEELRWSQDRTSAVRLEVKHAGQKLGEKFAVQDVTTEMVDRSGRITGIAWPEEFFPGLMLESRLRRGEQVIRITTMPLGEKVLIGDRETGHCYDPQVLTREDAPGSDRYGDSAIGLGPRQLVMRTVRRCGLLTLDGHALMDRAALPSAIYGRRPAQSQAAALSAAISELLAGRLLESVLGSRDGWGQAHFPPRDGQRTVPLLGYRPSQPRVIRPWAHTEPAVEEPYGVVQFVPGHLRRLRPGHSPSEAQRTAFREHCRRLGKADGWELPYGYTFVTDHTRCR